MNILESPTAVRSTAPRNYRWHAWLTSGKTFAAGVGVAAATQGALLLFGTWPTAVWVPMAVIVAALLAAACAAWRSPHSGTAAWAAALLVASLVCWHVVTAFEPPRFPYLGFVSQTTTALVAMLGALVALGVTADKALILCISLGLALAAAEAALRFRRQREMTQAAATVSVSDPAVRALQRNQTPHLAVPRRDFPFPIDEWVRGRSWPDDELMYILEPHGLFKQYYPDNPRGYFYEESDAEWAMRQHWQTPGDRSYFLTPLDAGGNRVRVHFRTPFRPREFNPQISFGRFAVGVGQQVSATLRCRSEKPRYLNALWIGATQPFPRVAPETGFNIGADWAEHTATATVTQASDEAVLLLVLPPDESPVDVEMVRLTVDGQHVTPQAIPNLHRSYMAYAMNSRGHRDREYEIPRPADVFRLVCLGDSFTFGQGVQSQHVVSAVLAARLNDQAQALGQVTRYEAVNCGVCGYGTREERLAYLRQARAYQPQLALVLMVLNDDLNSRDEQAQLAVAEQGSEIGQALRGAVGSRRDFQKSLAELGQLHQACEADGAKLVVAVFRHEARIAGGDWDRLIATVQPGLAELGVPFVDLGEAILARGGSDDLLVYPGGDPHPSPLAHAAAAEALEKFLRERNLVPLPR